MPEPATANMGLILPSETGDTGVWGSLLNTALGTAIDQHNHTTGKGVKVPIGAGTTLTADTPWNQSGSFFAITGIKAVDFEPRPLSEMTAYAGALFINSANNELTWRTTGGTNVQLTSGTSINSALIGGFGGDYGPVAALADYTDADDTYRFRQQLGAGVRQFGRVAVGDLDLYEFKANPAAGVPTTRVRHKSPASLAASYDLTWLAALPGTTTPLQVSSTGTITASNTFANATTFSGLITANAGVSATSLAASTTLAVTGLSSLNGGITTQSLQLTGTDTVKHPTRRMSLGAPAFLVVAGSSTMIPLTTGGGSPVSYTAAWRFSTNGDIVAAVPLRVGDRILSVTFNLASTTGTTVAVTCHAFADNPPLSAVFAVNGTSTGISLAQDTFTLSSLNYTLVSGDDFMVRAVCNNAANTMFLVSVDILWDRP